MSHFRPARVAAISVGALMVAVAVAAIIVPAAWQQSADDSATRVAGWRADIARLVEEARRVHASPSRPAHAPAFASAADPLAQRIPDLPDRLVVVEIQRLMAMLGDGHSPNTSSNRCLSGVRSSCSSIKSPMRPRCRWPPSRANWAACSERRVRRR